jgi:nitroreductase
VEYESFRDLVRRRRSYWHFRPDPIPDDDIEKIVDVARYAPSAFNSQLWEFVVLSDQELRDGVARIVAEALPGPAPGPRDLDPCSGPTAVPAKDPMGFSTAPVFILVLGDTRVRAFAPPHLRNDDGMWRTASTTSLAAAYEHMHLAATSLGLGTRWVSAVAHLPAEPKIREFLGIPAELMVYEMMALGYSDFRPRHKNIRELDEILHFGRCRTGEFRSDERIAEYFRQPVESP